MGLCDEYKTDKSTFLFSFNNKEKYNSRNNCESIFSGLGFGLRFGSSGYPEFRWYFKQWEIF